MNYYLVSYKIGDFIDVKFLNGFEDYTKITPKVLNYVKEELRKLIKEDFDSKDSLEKITFSIECGDISKITILGITFIEGDDE